MIRVLIVDDSKSIQKIVAKHVVDCGGEIVGIGNDGEEGITLFKEHAPDLVLLDITMPNRDGRECLKEILSHNPSASVIMLSAVSAPEVANECLAQGAIAFVNKATGFSDGTLRSQIQVFLKRSA